MTITSITLVVGWKVSGKDLSEALDIKDYGGIWSIDNNRCKLELEEDTPTELKIFPVTHDVDDTGSIVLGHAICEIETDRYGKNQLREFDLDLLTNKVFELYKYKKLLEATHEKFTELLLDCKLHLIQDDCGCCS